MNSWGIAIQHSKIAGWAVYYDELGGVVCESGNGTASAGVEITQQRPAKGVPGKTSSLFSEKKPDVVLAFGLRGGNVGC